MLTVRERLLLLGLLVLAQNWCPGSAVTRQVELLNSSEPKKVFRQRRRLQSLAQRLQPRVTVVQGLPSENGIQSLSDPNGTIWCGGAPTYWILGHQKEESPLCKVGGKWSRNTTAALQTGRDRHACVAMDVNKDGLEDIICTAGAKKGTGEGYTEIYLSEANSSLTKVPNGHGLQKYPTMRTRVAVTLKNRRREKEFVFIGTYGTKRQDGKPNEHRMFRTTKSGKFPYFLEVNGPWKVLFEATCAVAGDFTRDQRDDLVVCNKNGPPLLVRQGSNSTFARVPIPNKEYLKYWRNVRIADVTRDGVPDLVVVTWGQPSYLYVFRGIAAYPFFNFNQIYYQAKMGWASSNVEVLDVNRDGFPDIYVVQVDETKGKYYCGPIGTVTQLPPDVVPPLDKAKDVLLVGIRSDKKFLRISLNHTKPGCGAITQRWDDTTMLLGQGSFDYAGFGLLLEWR